MDHRQGRYFAAPCGGQRAAASGKRQDRIECRAALPPGSVCRVRRSRPSRHAAYPLLGQEEAPGEHCGDIHSPCVPKYWEQPAGARQLR